MSVTLDLEARNDLDENVPLNAVHVNSLEAEEQNLILATKAVAKPYAPPSGSTRFSRVITPAPNPSEAVNTFATEAIGTQSVNLPGAIESQALELAAELKNFPNAKEENKQSILIRVSHMVQMILELTHQLGEKERTKSHELELRHKRLTGVVSEGLISKGNTGVVMAVIGFAIQFGALLFQNENDQKLVRSIADQMPQIGNWFGAKTEADGAKASNELGLIISQMQDVSAAKSSHNSLTEGANAVMEAAKAVMRGANSNG